MPSGRVKRLLSVRRAVDLGAVVGVAIAVWHAADPPAGDDAGTRIFDLVYELSLAYLAAWIFNLLVITLPRRTDERRITQGVQPVIASIVQSGTDMMYFLTRAAGAVVPSGTGASYSQFRPSLPVLEQITPLLSPHQPYVPQLPKMGTVWGMVQRQIRRGQDGCAQLTPWLPFLNTEIVAAVNEIHFSTLAEMANLGDLGNETLDGMAGAFWTHLSACDNLLVAWAKISPAGKTWLRIPYAPGP